MKVFFLLLAIYKPHLNGNSFLQCTQRYSELQNHVAYCPYQALQASLGGFLPDKAQIGIIYINVSPIGYLTLILAHTGIFLLVRRMFLAGLCYIINVTWGSPGHKRPFFYPQTIKILIEYANPQIGP